jgi:hypothetical protein
MQSHKAGKKDPLNRVLKVVATGINGEEEGKR